MSEPVKERVAELGSQTGGGRNPEDGSRGGLCLVGELGPWVPGGGIPTFCCTPFGSLELEPGMF